MMSGFYSYFGGGAKKDTAKEAIVGIRQQLDLLEKREKHLESQIEAQNLIAKKNVTANKKAAMVALRRKKQFETHLEQTQNQINNLETQVHAIEEAKINKETARAMQQANKAIKGIHKDLNPAKIDDMVNDMEENRATAEELNDAFNRIGPQAEFDEADLEEELAQMQQEAIDEKMTGVSAPLGEPAGATKVQTPEQTEEEEMEAEIMKLRAEMAV